MNNFFGFLPLFAGLALTSALAEPTYFIVGTFYQGREIGWPEHMESYVLPLEFHDDITQARNFIRNRNGSLVKISVAPGGDGINREHLVEGAPEWNWHVQQFLGFPSVAFTDADPYSPSLLNNPAILSEAIKNGSWIGQTYAIMAELNPALTTQASKNKDGNLVLDWTRLGPYYAYTVEARGSGSGGEWQAVPGVVWPIREHHWQTSTTATTSPSQFYRVRAEIKKPAPDDPS